MRLLVVGAGSTGGYFGGRLAKAGRDVTFLVRRNRAENLRKNGLSVISPHGDFSIAPKLILAEELDSVFDAVLLTVKAFSLTAALDDVAPAIGPETMIIPVLNGMRHMDVLAERFGKKAVLGGVCKIPATLDGEGRVVQLGNFHDLIYGELDGSLSSRIRVLDDFMQDAGFDARLSQAITREMWEKWIMLASLGAITCLMRGNVGQIEAAPGGLGFVHGLLGEVVAIVKAVGEPPSEAVLANARAMLTAKGFSLTASMYRDMQQGGATEADQILGDLVARGQRAGLSTPLLSAAYTNLCVYQQQVR
ncbi:MAG TPA: 2-dehydropantoate 2-reductase [Rhizobiaceae bacterium]|nr:2-dehydropantoate 2-reductase [Rhizobiaceae bacterium]